VTFESCSIVASATKTRTSELCFWAAMLPEPVVEERPEEDMANLCLQALLIVQRHCELPTRERASGRVCRETDASDIEVAYMTLRQLPPVLQLDLCEVVGVSGASDCRAGAGADCAI
jgi:hypothetical protein